MITSSGVIPMKYTENRILCPYCQRNNNFELVVKKSEDKYYLGEKCPKCNHYEDFKLIPSRMAQDYPLVTQ